MMVRGARAALTTRGGMLAPTSPTPSRLVVFVSLHLSRRARRAVTTRNRNHAILTREDKHTRSRSKKKNEKAQHPAFSCVDFGAATASYSSPYVCVLTFAPTLGTRPKRLLRHSPQPRNFPSPPCCQRASVSSSRFVGGFCRVALVLLTGLLAATRAHRPVP